MQIDWIHHSDDGSGTLNLCFNALDRHVVRGRADEPAIAADRPTYEKNVYVDNATRGPAWEKQAIARFEKYDPAVIVISEWDINGTDESRFSLWAPETKTWVQTHYIYQGTYLEFEVYTRPQAAE